MGQRVYATGADYGRLAEDDFEGDEQKLGKRLRAASIEVEKLVRLAVYDTDDDGYPTDSDVAEAFTEATCAIVEHWSITDDPTGAEAILGAVKIGSVSLGGQSNKAGDQMAGEKLAARIGSRAVDILRNTGLWSSTVVH
jgi:hypothetical protein